MVKFPCHAKLDEDVDWARVKSDAKYIYRGSLGMDVDWHDRRFKMMSRNHLHTLVIHNVTVNDSAYYRCVEDKGFGNRHIYGLTVQGDFLLLVSINYLTLSLYS